MTMRKKDISGVAIEVAPGGVVKVIEEPLKTNEYVGLGERYISERSHYLYETVKE